MNKYILASSLVVLGALLAACDNKKPNDSNNVNNLTQDQIKNTVANSTAGNEAPANPEVADGVDADLAEMKQITQQFGATLKAELKKAMKEGGPINGLTVCETKAMPITEEVAKQHNVALKRVSLKNRNPDNAPNDWQAAVLKDFDARVANGEDPVTMAFHEINETDGKKQLRFMKALPTGGLCLECHGSSIDADVQAKITELYPEDKATGYQKNQVRGAVVLVKDLN